MGFFEDNQPPAEFLAGDTPPPQGAEQPTDPSAFFNQLFPGDYLDSAMLMAKEAELNKAGIKVLRNAEGRAGKIQLANGQIIDVVQGGGTGLNRKQWLTGDGGTGGQFGTGSLAQGYGETYNLPTLAELQSMPGYQAGQDAYLKGIQNSAFAKGTGLTGGTVQRIGQGAADYAAQNYASLAGLKNNAFNTNYSVFRNNGNDIFGRYATLAQLGANSAGGATS